MVLPSCYVNWSPYVIELHSLDLKKNTNEEGFTIKFTKTD